MELLGKYGKEDLAILYIAKQEDKIVEFVESLQPPIPREEKWVLVISTMYGCPIGCLMCDAGEYYHGKISTEGMLEEIDFMINNFFSPYCSSGITSFLGGMVELMIISMTGKLERELVSPSFGLLQK